MSFWNYPALSTIKRQYYNRYSLRYRFSRYFMDWTGCKLWMLRWDWIHKLMDWNGLGLEKRTHFHLS